VSDKSEDFFKAIKSTFISAGVATAAALLGANLVVVALAWESPPEEGGIVTITFLMMMSFVVFISELHQIMRTEYLITIINVKEKENKDVEIEDREIHMLSKSIRMLHVSGLLFTMIAFWIISYKYLISLEEVGYNVTILLLPFILFFLYWMPKFIGVEKEIGFLSPESMIQLVIQIIVLVLICLDFFKIITIP